MGCTIYYKGTLKENVNESDVCCIVAKHLQGLNAELTSTVSSIIINFTKGQSEPLVFEFKENKVDYYCKWNGTDTEEFYKILDFFIDLKPLFKSLRIDDDEGIWNEYVIQKQPCKIKLRPLSSIELEFLGRINENEKTSPNTIEKLVISQTGLKPRNIALLRAITQDFIQIMGIESIDAFNPQIIIDYANSLMRDVYRHIEIDSFGFYFSRLFVMIWVHNAFKYKNISAVRDIPESVRGLTSSKIAAIEGIESMFFNRHAGGANNSKEAEMRKLAKKYYSTGALGEVVIIDKPERELELLFSMMDYLGFNYTGPIPDDLKPFFEATIPLLWAL